MALKKFHNIVVGISGGVDSAISAYLLKQRGFNVIGAYMQNWDVNEEQGQCTNSQDIDDAKYCCDKLSIPFYHINFVKEYWNFVFDSFINDYKNGFTPNPDILCNRYLKFNYFYRYAMEILKADAIATGHYVKTSFGNFLENYQPNTNVKLLYPKDKWKDQTFFLSQVEQISLRKAMFPLGDLLKTEVKLIANEIGLYRIAKKKESMGICFIGNRKFKNFISEYIENKNGVFIEVDTGKILGEHSGVHHWTNGQRSCLACHQTAVYVVQKIASTNEILVAEGHDHPALFSKFFLTEKPHWINYEPENLKHRYVFSCCFKFQHVHNVMNCQLYQLKNSTMIVYIEKFCRAITPGQFAVFYKDNECLGSARIVENGSSKFIQNLKEFIS